MTYLQLNGNILQKYNDKEFIPDNKLRDIYCDPKTEYQSMKRL